MFYIFVHRFPIVDYFEAHEPKRFPTLMSLKVPLRNNHLKARFKECFTISEIIVFKIFGEQTSCSKSRYQRKAPMCHFEIINCVGKFLKQIIF